MKKNSKFKFFIILILISICIFFILKNINKNNSNSNNLTESGNSIAENSTVTTNSTEPEISNIQKINNERKTHSAVSTTRKLPVLMYHFFYDEQAGETGKDNNYIEIKNFEQQIKYLADNNYYVPSWQEVEDFVNGKIGLPEKSVIITVDDGDESFFRLAVPILEKYNFYATSFLITSWYGNVVNECTSLTVDFQSHSNNMHIPGSNGKGAFLTLPYEKACEDLNICKQIIGNNCIVFCYPFGHYNDNCKKTLKDCNYKLAFTVEYGRVAPGMDCYQLPRIRMSKTDTLNSFISKVK
ncbi:MAG: hypothetical protein E7313_00860 [Clostridiales bacterium]|nr:hypothetical protein [Clostridiales bacterium]